MNVLGTFVVGRKSKFVHSLEDSNDLWIEPSGYEHVVLVEFNFVLRELEFKSESGLHRKVV